MDKFQKKNQKDHLATITKSCYIEWGKPTGYIKKRLRRAARHRINNERLSHEYL